MHGNKEKGPTKQDGLFNRWKEKKIKMIALLSQIQGKYNCSKARHASCCPELLTRVGISNLQFGNIIIQVHPQGSIPLDWILLDTYSTDNVVNNTATMEMNLEVYNEEDTFDDLHK